ncbi:hypothetical protein LJ737_20760 [Hymenobacter sp. 15J16-1T3B]|uniref:hypothetical protein n=1 Tax=Hymenobacter sp. 15J16-1T3B TaxID=2886941 RepID=UPI001D1227EB|nr:hypothetical protein [Hymenobacter sp. 15J16-1T3B]MCC3159685.1 hypothetical protein [Hymenobacter sp. 15J16-1T3B]
MEELIRLAGVLAPVLKKSKEEVADAAKSDETAAELAEAIKAHITNIDTSGYKRAELKLKKDVEKLLAAKGVPDASFDNLTAGFDYLEQQAREKAGKVLTDEDVLSLPAVKKLINQHTVEKEQIKTVAKTEAEKALEEQVKTFRREQTNSKVEAEAARLIAELNPVFSQNPTVAANQRRILLDQLKAGQYEVKDGQLIPLKEDGTYQTDEHGHAVKFEDVVRGTVTSYYDLPVSKDRQSAGHDQSSFSGGIQPQLEHFKGKLPSDEKEYMALANDPNIAPAALKEVQVYWESKKGQ